MTIRFTGITRAEMVDLMDLYGADSIVSGRRQVVTRGGKQLYSVLVQLS